MQGHLIAYALSTPWALMPERMAAYATVLASHYAGAWQQPAPDAKSRRDARADMVSAIRSAAARGGAGGSGSIAIVPVMGAIVEWPSQIDICDGGTSARAVAAELAEAEADPGVSQILMVFSTPGGSVYGVQELADVINRAKAKKPVYGVAQSLAASAGYWLLSQCTKAYCSPGGEVGSIGVYSGYENIKKALEASGVDVELFAAGKYKVELSPFGDGLSDEARAYQLQRSQDYYAAFTNAVAKGRGVSASQARNGMGQGRVLGATAALAENMVDGIATVEQVIASMRSGRGLSGASAGAISLRPSLQRMSNELALLELS